MQISLENNPIAEYPVLIDWNEELGKVYWGLFPDGIGGRGYFLSTYILDLASGEVKKLAEGELFVNAISPDYRYLVSNHELREVESGRLITTLPGMYDYLDEVIFSDDNKNLALVYKEITNEGTWEIRNHLASFDIEEKAIYSFNLTEDSYSLIGWQGKRILITNNQETKNSRGLFTVNRIGGDLKEHKAGKVVCRRNQDNSR